MFRFAQFRFLALVYCSSFVGCKESSIYHEKSVGALSYSLDYRPCTYKHRESRNGLSFGVREKHLYIYHSYEKKQWNNITQCTDNVLKLKRGFP